MPVRPLTTGEQHLAVGSPTTPWLMLFGASQGFLTHLRINGMTLSSKSMVSTPFAKATLPALVIGGAGVGLFVGMQFYGDADLRRMVESHALDARHRTDG